jgi:hypothetical protein
MAAGAAARLSALLLLLLLLLAAAPAPAAARKILDDTQCRRITQPGLEVSGERAARRGVARRGERPMPTHRCAPQTVTQMELCSLCRTIVKNRYRWDWGADFEVLATNTPHHARMWTEFFICRLTQCSDFRAGSCNVRTGANSYMTVTPW